ncbi:MAG: dipeptide ABC transporter ATP-binding protein [Deltaproteobacteria bacterium]|nr:dipeptide ABC transporter ATP-binding protein [Deltaproteobacteria bacterium]
MTLLRVENLHTHFATPRGAARGVDGVSFRVEEGETLAIVGESGCGKSVTALSLMGLIRQPGYHPQGQVWFQGQDLLAMSEDDRRRLRGNQISMIFQEPMTALNPVFTIGQQLAEPLRLHRGMDAFTARLQGQEILGHLGMPDPERVWKAYPHQLSGGMRQRAMIAMAFACRPRLLIADEPTTALDVTVQAQILHLIRTLQQETGMGLVLITHDLGVVNQMADRVMVMYSGKGVEEGSREQVLGQPMHPYTRGLLASIPRGGGGPLNMIPGRVAPATEFPDSCRFAPRCSQAGERCAQTEPGLFTSAEASRAAAADHRAACFLYDPVQPLAPREDAPAAPPVQVPDPFRSSQAGPLLVVENLTAHFPIRKGFLRKETGRVRAVDGVSFSLEAGRTLALVGESGCGKTTLALSLLRLTPEARGRVVFQGSAVLDLPESHLRPLRRSMQVIFQDPYAALNPRFMIGEIVGEGLRTHEPGLTPAQFQQRVEEALAEVGLPPQAAQRYPHEFSGGQRQRVAIARALVLRPSFLVLDEPSSALDVSVQAQILNLLKDLQERHRLAYLFITHDLGVVRHLAHDVAVMYLGRVVEHGPAERVFASPVHPYTQSLLAAQPSLTLRREGPPPLMGDVPSPSDPPPGCPFHPRCALLAAQAQAPWAPRCRGEYPPERNAAGGGPANITHGVRCWGE